MSRSRKFDTNFGHSRSRRTETNPPTQTGLAPAGNGRSGIDRARRGELGGYDNAFEEARDKVMAPEEEPPRPLLQTSFPLEVASEAAHQFSPQRSPLGLLRVRIGKVAANFPKTFFGLFIAL